MEVQERKSPGWTLSFTCSVFDPGSEYGRPPAAETSFSPSFSSSPDRYSYINTFLLCGSCLRMLVPFLVWKLFINYLSIKQKRVPFVLFSWGFFFFFLSGEMDFRSGGARRGGREERNANRKISNQRREKNPALRWNVWVSFIFLFFWRTRRSLGILLVDKRKDG